MITVAELLVREELRGLAVNNRNEFRVFRLDNFNGGYGLFGVEEDEEAAKKLADVAATNAGVQNDYEDDGETVAFGIVYLVHNFKGENIYTGQIKKNIIH